jgi:hypothetical protein
MIFGLTHPNLKGLSHEIEENYKWYKLREPNYKMNL